MPRNASGTYTLPVSPFTPNTTIVSADVNSDFSDIATALTQSLATTGVSSMTGPLRLADGSAAAPSLTLASDTTTGWYKSASGSWTYVGAGTAVMTLAAAGGTITNLTVTNLTVTGSFVVASARIIGEIIEYGGAAAPSLWLLCYGQAISRTTYPSLFSTIGTTFGVGDGLTTFNAPDYRGRVGVGKDDMGGIAASRITAAGCGITGTTLGAVGGEQTHVLITTELSQHTHAVVDPTHTHSNSGFVGSSTNVFSPAGATTVPSGPVANPNTGASGTGISISNQGTSTAHNNVQPTLIINKIIYAGV